MNMNIMNFLLGKAVASEAGEARSTQLGLLAALMPGYQGVLLSAMIARREAVAPPPPDPKVVAQQAELLKKLLEVAGTTAHAVTRTS